MDWKTMLSYISGSVDEGLLLRNEYLVAENRVLLNQNQGRLRLTDGERRSLAELGKRLGKQALDEVASIVNPDTILGWHRRLVAKKFDSAKSRQYPGRPRVDADIEELVVGLAKENKSWGYDRIAVALANLGHEMAKASWLQAVRQSHAARVYGRDRYRHPSRSVGCQISAW